MQLKSLHINGFKSFAKKGDIEFTTPITAIVGPNGSGKSNIAESFRFVLGEQSIKSMRGKKGEDLIFNGSDSISRSNRASVTVVLDNSIEEGGSRPFPIDFEEIRVERVVHRDGVNEYSINDSKTRLRDVQELLASANIGSTGHHIISQGEADRILIANPKERREMIEDALGLKIFQYKKIKSEKKLIKTLENIEQVEILRKEVIPHLKFLERQVKKSEKSLELQENLKTFYAEYLRREDSYIAFHHDRLMKEKAVPDETLENLSDELSIAKAKLEKDNKNDKGNELIVLEKDISRVRGERQDMVRAIGQIEGQITYLERRIEYLKKNQDETKESPIEYKELKHATDMIENSAEMAIKSKDVRVLERALSDVVTSLRVLLKSATNVEKAVDTKAEDVELDNLRKEKKDFDSSLEKINEEGNVLNRQYEKLRTSIEIESSENREAERDVFRVMNAQREAEHESSALQRELDILERDRVEFKRELQEAVSLLGRDASAYFKHQVLDENGSEIGQQQIATEKREIQRERRRTLEKMKIRLEELGFGNNEELMKEYKDVKERDEFLVREIGDLTASVVKLEELISGLTAQLNEQFADGIEKIGKEFERLFTLMFDGGTAELKLIKPKIKRKKEEDNFIELSDDMSEEIEDVESEEGVEIDVKLPNKRVRGLDMLSGGERALTSIALIFAMSRVNPPLFIILDETDAALDEANSRRYGDMISTLAEKSQLILITHNRETMSRAGVLYGITMAGDGISKLLSVKLDEAVSVAK